MFQLKFSVSTVCSRSLPMIRVLALAERPTGGSSQTSTMVLRRLRRPGVSSFVASATRTMSLSMNS